jgi:hypothetical protein
LIRPPASSLVNGLVTAPLARVFRKQQFLRLSAIIKSLSKAPFSKMPPRDSSDLVGSGGSDAERSLRRHDILFRQLALSYYRQETPKNFVLLFAGLSEEASAFSR